MSEHVRTMFATIAPKYDVANTALSFGIHHWWRKELLRRSGLKELVRTRADIAVLDCATGTGDVAMTFAKLLGKRGTVIGTDFCAEMMTTAPEKSRAAGVQVRYEVADAMDLPYHNDMFDCATIAFGIRNVDVPVRALQEMARVVRSGGRVLVLEFGQPKGLFGAAYRLYSNTIIPFIGGLLTGNREAYRYLNRTAAAFPSGEAFLMLMHEAGVFSSVEAVPLTFGVAYVYAGVVK